MIDYRHHLETIEAWERSSELSKVVVMIYSRIEAAKVANYLRQRGYTVQVGKAYFTSITVTRKPLI